MYLVLLLMAVMGLGLFITQNAKASARGVEAVMQWEQFRAEPYQDQAGHWTIGYGHKILPGESFSWITEAEAENILRNDLAIAERAIHDLVRVPISQTQFDALVSFVFNVGRAAFAESTLLRKLNAGDHDGAAAEFERWRFVTVNGEKVASNGLLRRREHERALFVSGQVVA